MESFAGALEEMFRAVVRDEMERARDGERA